MRRRCFAALLLILSLLFSACAVNETDVTATAEETSVKETETDVITVTQAVTGTEADVTAVTETDVVSEAQTGTDTVAVTEAQTGPETETDAAAVAVTDVQTDEETEAETDAEPVISYENAYTSKAFLDFIRERYGADIYEKLSGKIGSGGYDNEYLYALTGKSVYVLFDEYKGAAYKKSRAPEAHDKSVISLGFCGDIMLSDGWQVMQRYEKYGGDIKYIADADTVSTLESFDVMAATNEYPVSSRGEKINKTYTFRAKEENLKILNELGVDFVSTANNHIYDYGPDAFFDTFKALDKYGIDHAGAGRDLSEASEPFYYVINGRKIAIICGSRAEKNLKTPLAADSSAGVFGMYDPEDMISAVKKADESCDFVIIMAHWGAEWSSQIEDIIRLQGRLYVDAGADLIIGSHAHALQGIEIYKGRTIAYNLGNFLFNGSDMKSGIIQLTIDPADMTASTRFIACIQDHDHVRVSKGGEKAAALDYMRGLSPGIRIDEDGNITKK